MTHRQRQLRRRRHRPRAGSKIFLGLGLVGVTLVIGALSVIGWIVAVAASARAR
jgi:hypothetical protein